MIKLMQVTIILLFSVISFSSFGAHSHGAHHVGAHHVAPHAHAEHMSGTTLHAIRIFIEHHRQMKGNPPIITPPPQHWKKAVPVIIHRHKTGKPTLKVKTIYKAIKFHQHKNPPPNTNH